jgi:formylglycine-generating enzyme
VCTGWIARSARGLTGFGLERCGQPSSLALTQSCSPPAHQEQHLKTSGPWLNPAAHFKPSFLPSMRKSCISLFAVLVVVSAWAQKIPDTLVLVEGGTFKNNKSGYTVMMSNFLIGKYEVTQKEWTAVMGSNPANFKGENLPVETVSWYDCIEYCNKRSLQEGLNPYYTIDKVNKDPDNQTESDDIKWTVTLNSGANGYRLPTEVEWEYAAGGGQRSKNYTYSGSDDVEKVGWYWQNSGDAPLSGTWHWPLLEQNKNRTHPVGSKEPNELGLYDMSGNVREWCWDWYGEQDANGAAPKTSASEAGRVWKGGGWIGGDFCCAPTFRNNYEANNQGSDQGFRVCRNP